MSVFLSAPDLSYTSTAAQLFQSKPTTVDSLPTERSATDVSGLWGTLHLTETTNLSLLADWVVRAKKTGLYICIDFHRSADRLWNGHFDDDTDPLSPANSSLKLAQVLEVLCASSRTWHSLTILGATFLSPILKADLSSLRNAPHLLCISIILEHNEETSGPTTADGSSIFHRPLPDSTIPHVAISNYSLIWETFPFHTLTSLTLGPFIAGNRLPWDLFFGAIGGSQVLLSLVFTGAIPSTTQAQHLHLHLTLPSVRTPSLSRLVQSNLQHLTDYMSLPSLTSLILCLANETQDFLPFMQSLPGRFPHLTDLSIDQLWIPNRNLASLPPFFEHFAALMHLRLNFQSIYDLHMCFGDALLQNTHQPNFLPSLTSVVLANVPIRSVQDFVFLRMHGSRPISHLTLHHTEVFLTECTPAWTTWLVDNTKELLLTYGSHRPWALE
ncbi:hypothetical protein B0H17DRAFT_1197188 [Mycena rosella]|uniref:Uncharacterized protein n=1 Tax=Mycena rosella TaxID=1033263 RepID=A0AAD7GMG7_MYCRO|nr:hypothetical protein B0H17DRAFT_1197188 [Mycena rosella]